MRERQVLRVDEVDGRGRGAGVLEPDVPEPRRRRLARARARARSGCPPTRRGPRAGRRRGGPCPGSRGPRSGVDAIVAAVAAQVEVRRSALDLAAEEQVQRRRRRGPCGGSSRCAFTWTTRPDGLSRRCGERSIAHVAVLPSRGRAAGPPVARTRRPARRRPRARAPCRSWRAARRCSPSATQVMPRSAKRAQHRRRGARPRAIRPRLSTNAKRGRATSDARERQQLLLAERQHVLPVALDVESVRRARRDRSASDASASALRISPSSGTLPSLAPSISRSVPGRQVRPLGEEGDVLERGTHDASRRRRPRRRRSRASARRARPGRCCTRAPARRGGISNERSRTSTPAVAAAPRA